MRGSTFRTIFWLDFYGLMRARGIPAGPTMVFLDSGGDAAEIGLDELTADLISLQEGNTRGQSNAARLKGKAVGNAIGTTMAGAGAVLQTIPVVGNIAGAIVAAAGGIVVGLTELFTVSCDAWDCPKPTTYHRRAITGRNPPPGSTLNKASKTITYFHRRGLLLKFIHDGAVINGFGDPKNPNDPDLMGRVNGVNPTPKGIAKPYAAYWKKHKTQQGIPAEERNVRARSATWVLEWMERKIDCRCLSCMEEVIKASGSFDDQRRRGSRWMASFVWMGRDLWDGLQQLGPRGVEILRANNLGNAADSLARGPKGDEAYPWSHVASYMSWNGLRSALKVVATELAAPGSAPAAIQAEARRGRTITGAGAKGLSIVREMRRQQNEAQAAQERTSSGFKKAAIGVGIAGVALGVLSLMFRR